MNITLERPPSEVPNGGGPGIIYSVDIERMQELDVIGVDGVRRREMCVWVVEPAPARWLPSRLFEKRP